MSLLVKFCRIIIVLMVVLAPVSLGYAAVEFMPVDQLRPGMQGIAKTVVAGNTIEEFNVEVLGVMKDKGPSGDLILVRTSGPLIDRTGGIAQGMSGSPVYIDGKLVGAIAYGWSLTDHRVGMVTPISDMLKLWELSDPKNHPPAQHPEAVPSVPDETLEPVTTPVMAAGFGDKALALLQEKLKPFNLVPYAVGDAPAGTQYSAIEPGGAVGVQLVSGDVNLGAIGTVTYVDGDRVLAFGHPFLKKGNIGYLLSQAYIYTTVSGLENSFKVGTTGQSVGLINQDRGAGVAGELNRYPSIIPVRVITQDKTGGAVRDAAFQVVQDEQLAPILTAAGVLNVIDKTLDRQGAGSARVSFEVSGGNMPGDVLKRENMFYSPTNVGEAAIAEVFEGLSLLANNQFNPVDIMDVKVNVTLDSERRTATIMEANSVVASAKPGDTVNIKVNLKPFRGETITRTVCYTVPKDQAPGLLTLEVRGGGMVPLTQILLKKQGLDLEELNPDKKLKTFEDTIKDFAERDRNNDIVVEPLDTDLSGLDGLMEGGKKTGAKLDTKEPTPKPNPKPEASEKKAAPGVSSRPDAAKKKDDKSFITTDYIITGDTQILLNIVNKPDK